MNEEILENPVTGEALRVLESTPAALFSEFKGSIRQASFRRRVLLDALAPIASLLGYRGQLDRHSTSGPTRR